MQSETSIEKSSNSFDSPREIGQLSHHQLLFVYTNNNSSICQIVTALSLHHPQAHAKLQTMPALLIKPCFIAYFLLPKNPRFFFSAPSSFEYLLFFSSLPLVPDPSPLAPFAVAGRELMLKAARLAVGGTGGVA